MKEKVIITFIACVLGLLLSTLAFFIYQSSQKETIGTKKVAGTQSVSSLTPTASVAKNLTIEEPIDEAVVTKRSIHIKGKAKPGNKVVISSLLEDVITTAKADGSFAENLSIEAGPNTILVMSIAPDETVDKTTLSVTYSTEEF